MARRKTVEQRLSDNYDDVTEMSAIAVIAPIAIPILVEIGKDLLTKCMASRGFGEIQEMAASNDRRVRFAIKREMRKRGLSRREDASEIENTLIQTLIESNEKEVLKSLSE